MIVKKIKMTLHETLLTFKCVGFFFFKSILLLFLTRYEEQQKLQLLLHCRALQGRRPPTMLID